ncbi:hypothetical protein DFAR_3460017 [Desulfarculales bacterium]
MIGYILSQSPRRIRHHSLRGFVFMRLTLAIYSMHGGGVEWVMTLLSDAWADQGHELTLGHPFRGGQRFFPGGLQGVLGGAGDAGRLAGVLACAQEQRRPTARPALDAEGLPPSGHH